MQIKQKLIKEKQDLLIKIEKLENFILSFEYNDLKKIHKKLLAEQLKVMRKYLTILEDRIFLFT